MVAALGIVVPVGVAIYFIAGMRRSLALLCGLPLILFFGRSVYLDTPQWNITVLGPPLRAGDFVLAGVILVALYLRLVRPAVKRIRPGPETAIVVGLLAFLGLQFCLTLLEGEPVRTTARATMLFLYPAVGYFVWLDLLRRFTEKEAWALIRAIAVVSVGLTVLYCIQAIGVKVYPYTPYLFYNAGGSALTVGGTYVRDFYTFTPFAGFTLAYLLAAPSLRWRWGAALAIMTAGFLFTLTRSIVGAALAAGLVAFVHWVGDTKSSLGRRRTAFAVALGIVGGVGVLLWVAAPVLNALLDRYAGLGGGLLADPNAAARVRVVGTVASGLKDIGQLPTGVGMLNYGYIPSGMSTGYIAFSDSSWTGLLLYLGIVGVALYGALLVAGVAGGATLAWRNARSSRMGLFVLLWVIQIALVSTSGDSLMTVGVVGGLPFAILTVARHRLWQSEHVAEVERESLVWATMRPYARR